jgi:hypothetical protein
VLSSRVLDVTSVCDRVLMLHLGKLVLAGASMRCADRCSAGELVLRTRAGEGVGGVAGTGARVTLKSVDAADDGSLLLHLDPPGATAARTDAASRKRHRGAHARALRPACRCSSSARATALEELFVDLLGRSPQ